MIKALRYYSDGPGIDSRWCHWIFNNIFLPTAPWPWGRLSHFRKWVPGTFPAGKVGRCVRLTIWPPACAECHEIWEPKPPGTLWATPGLLQDCFTCTFHKYYTSNRDLPEETIHKKKWGWYCFLFEKINPIKNRWHRIFCDYYTYNTFIVIIISE